MPSQPLILNRALIETAVRQALTRSGVSKQVDLKEIRAISFLAARLFGDGKKGVRVGDGYGGVVEFDAVEPGIIMIGYYLDPPIRQDYIRGPQDRPRQRRTKMVLRGASHRELVDQACTLGITGVIGGGYK